jgi:hypothetical protein
MVSDGSNPAEDGSMARRGLDFGIFLAPFHRLGDNPTLAMARGLELIEWLDHLGYDEAWIGEHHSAGWEIVALPELMIAAAAERTRHIRLGTGVTSLPYHHPFLVAQRFVQLDHMTRGRVMLGCGPGALPSDAYMLGIDPVALRRRMVESLDAIVLLLRGEEPVTIKTDWFELNEARLHLAPYTYPLPNRGGEHDHALRHDGGGQARARRAVDRRRHSGRPRGIGAAMADRRGHGRRAWCDDGPARVANRRQRPYRRG